MPHNTLVNRRWVLKHRPASIVTGEELEQVDAPIPPLAAGQILMRNLYLSLDPTNRLWMSGRDQYLAPVGVGDVMRGVTIGVVEQSRSPDFAVGDLVSSIDGGWQRYAVTSADLATRLPRLDGVPLSAFLSVLGGTGVTAYFGLLEVGALQPGETVVVSAAAGAVGSIVGQIAKIKGCRVIGIAGGANKCRWITEQLGFDGAIDYKSEEVGAALDRLCPEGVDVDFENVGGAIMDAVFSRLRRNGRMVLCGMISGYNDEGPLRGPTDFGRILMQRLTVRGFIVIDYFPRAAEALADLGRWIGEGRIHWKDHIVDGLENAPHALTMLFNGRNDGKLLVRIADLA